MRFTLGDRLVCLAIALLVLAFFILREATLVYYNEAVLMLAILAVAVTCLAMYCDAKERRH